MKLGIVGTGTITREVLPLLRSCGWEPAAICGTLRSMEETKALQIEHTIAAAHNDYDQMLKEAEIDAVYIAVPNHLHFCFAEQALMAGKHVIVEKPMASNYREASALETIAKEKKLYLFEAITTIYLPNYLKTREWLARIGEIKLVSCNFSQYSRRYDAFRAGEILPAFDPAKSGGALMDLNHYNLHWLLGLFGVPEAVRYAANLERGIDTSGILTLDYGSFQAVSVAAKDCAAPWCYTIQGTKGYLEMHSPANFCLDIKLHLNNGTEETFAENPVSRLLPEFRIFAEQIASGEHSLCYKHLAHSVLVSKVQTEARLGAGIRFPADETEKSV